MLAFVLLGLATVSQLPTTDADCGRVVCYHTNWSQYRPGDGKFFPDDIDPALCTHITYAFAKLANNRLAPFEWNDDSTDWSVGLYERFQQLKQRNPNVKTLLAVGGWNLGSGPFTQIAGSPSTRQAFVTSSIKFLRDRGFDGLDLDWEYPANRGSPPEDKTHFTELVTELKAGFEAEAARTGQDRLLLTAAVAAGKDKIDTAYDVPALSRELDFISLMSYDLHGSWETTAGHNSPLYARSGETGDDRYLNVDFAAQYWVQKGADPSKLNIGMGTYGRSFTLASQSNYDIGASAPRAGQAGQFTREAGFLAYYEICDLLKRGGQREYNDEQKVPYIHLNDQWIGYDDPESLREKVRYAKQNNFGGVMVWALPLDDFSGSHCGEGPFPLLHAINDECGSSSGPVNTPRPTHATQRPTQSPTQATQGHTQGPTQGPASTASSGTNRPRTTHEPHTITQTDEFTCPNKDGFYPSPVSCRQYFICASRISYSVQCADGLVFNRNTGFCDLPSHYTCTLGDAPATHTTPRQTRPTSSSGTGTATNSPSVVSSTRLPEATTTLIQMLTSSFKPATTQKQNPPSSGVASTIQPDVTTPVVQMLTTPFKPATTQKQSPSSSTDVQNFCQSHSDGIFGDPTDCAYFFECANHRTFRERCAPGTGWRGDIMTCDRIENIPGCDHTA